MKAKKFLAYIMVCSMVISAVFFKFGSVDIYSADYTASKSRVSVHDPSVFKDPKTNQYYVFGSHIEAARSGNLQSWTRFTNGYTANNNTLFGNLSQNLKNAFAWSGENLGDCEGGFAVWAPDVIYNPDYINSDGTKGAYVMYFCTSSNYMTSVIAYAVSNTAEGPYTFVDTLIYSGFTSNDSYAKSSTKNVNRKYTTTNIDELIASGEVTYNNNWFNGTAFNNYLYPNAIDPTIYYDTDGKMYMCYGSWSGGIFTIEINPKTGKCIHPKTGNTSDGRLVDSYFGTKISGGYFKSGEGPFIEYNNETGYYYLWVTYGGLTATGGYNMRVFRSKNALGPFVDAAGNSAVLGTNTNLDSIGLKVMGNYKFSSLSTAYMACGHNSVLKDDDGSWYLLYHARFNNGTEYHEVRVHQMYFNDDGWPVVAPYEYSGNVISEGGYNKDTITGSYEYINHGNDTGSKIYTASTINLNSDGTISGAVSGTWEEAGDSAKATLTIGGVKYKGYFFGQYDETGTGKRVMTFTVVGSNNCTIWGAKTTSWDGSERSSLRDYTNNSSQTVYAPDTVSESESGIYIGDIDILSDVSYFIINKNSGKAIDLDNGNTADGTNIQQWTKTGGKQQEWRFVDVGDGYFKIVSMADEGKCIAVENATSDDGTNIELQAYSGSSNQQWKIARDGSYYAILSRCSNELSGMDIYDWSTENGGNLNQWNYWGGDCQLWSITPVYPKVVDGNYLIRNINSCLWVSSGSDNLQQSENRDIWNFVTNTDGTYSIKNSDGLAVTVQNSDGTDGNNLYLDKYTGSEAQKFTIMCNKDGSYSILSVVSDSKSGFDVYNISKESGARICQWTFWGGSGQKFILQPAVEEDINVIPGDLNSDGKLNAFDMALYKRGLLYGFSDNKYVKKASDVNLDGKADKEDMILLKKILLSAD